LFDALERTTPLAGQAAGLIGSFETLDASCAPAACAVGYSGALLLLVVAGTFVLVINSLQARARRRVAARPPSTEPSRLVGWGHDVAFPRAWSRRSDDPISWSSPCPSASALSPWQSRWRRSSPTRPTRSSACSSSSSRSRSACRPPYGECGPA